MKQKTETIKHCLLALIILLSFTIRLIHLDKNPFGFFCDEASTGVDAQLILRTGHDRNNNYFPLFFKGFNFDNVSPYQVYLTVPFVGIFGLTEKAVRLAPVFWSTLEILIFFFLLREFLPTNFALVGAAFLSICPWHFHLSRTNMGDYYSWTLLTLTATLFLTKALKSKKTIFSILSSFFFGLATYSYTPARLITPMLLSISVFIFLTKRFYRAAIFTTVVYFVTIIPSAIFHINNPYSFQRLKDTMETNLKEETKEQRIFKISPGFFKKYYNHYSDDFLFKKGDSDFPGQIIRRHSIAGIGLFYSYQKWLILLGIIWSIYQFIKNRKAEFVFVLLLLFLFPLPDSLTKDSVPYATRSYLGVLPLNILNAFGVFAIFSFLKKFTKTTSQNLKIAVFALMAIIIVFSFRILFKHFKENPRTTSGYWGWQYGPKEIIQYFLQVENQYDELIMDGNFNAPEIFFKFYAPHGCQKCKIGDINLLDRRKKQLFALSPENLVNLNYQLKKTIYYPNGQAAFKIVEFNQ